MYVRALRRESHISAFPQAKIEPVRTFVENILPLSVMEVQLCLCRLPYHFLLVICPEQRVSAEEHGSNDSATRKSTFHRTMND